MLRNLERSFDKCPDTSGRGRTCTTNVFNRMNFYPVCFCSKDEPDRIGGLSTLLILFDSVARREFPNSSGITFYFYFLVCTWNDCVPQRVKNAFKNEKNVLSMKSTLQISKEKRIPILILRARRSMFKRHTRYARYRTRKSYTIKNDKKLIERTSLRAVGCRFSRASISSRDQGVDISNYQP